MAEFILFFVSSLSLPADINVLVVVLTSSSARQNNNRLRGSEKCKLLDFVI